MLTTEQLTALKNAINAETNATLVGYRNNGQTTMIASWYNNTSNTDAWNSAVSQSILFDSTDIAKFDNITAGKRDAWRMLMDFAPCDATRIKTRKGIQDIWGDADSVTVLQNCLRKATKAEVVFGGTSVTTNTVTGLKLNWEGQISGDDVASALSQ
jgi:hypothetical protein